MKLRPSILIAIWVMLLVACSTNSPAGKPSQTPGISTTAVNGDTPPATLASVTPVSSDVPILRPSDTPKAEGSAISGVWNVYYSSTEPRFSFEYPALYDTEAYSQCQVTQIQDKDYLEYVRFGYRSELGVVINDLPSLDQYVERWMNGKDRDSKTDLTINGLPALTIDYRFGGVNRFGTATFLSRDNLIFLFNFTAGATCDLPEIGLNELAIFKHAVETITIYPSQW